MRAAAASALGTGTGQGQVTEWQELAAFRGSNREDFSDHEISGSSLMTGSLHTRKPCQDDPAAKVQVGVWGEGGKEQESRREVMCVFVCFRLFFIA